MSNLPSNEALQLAAQVWCQPNTSHMVCDPELTTEVARMLDLLATQREIGVALRLREQGINPTLKQLRE